MNGMGYMYGYHWGWGGWMAMWLGFWLLIILGIFFIIRALAGRKGGEGKSALDILNERYARGEITKNEYDEKKKEILGK